jgi:hypothetical protein
VPGMCSGRAASSHRARGLADSSAVPSHRARGFGHSGGPLCPDLAP